MFLHASNEALYQWGGFVAVFLAVYGGLTLLRRFLWKRFISQEGLLQRLGGPLTLASLTCALGVALQALPESIRSHSTPSYAIKISLILSCVWTLERVLTYLIRSAAYFSHLTNTTRTLLLILIRVVFFSLGLLSLLDTLGISITPLLASLGVGSVAVALALQETLTNLFSGFYLLLDRPVRLGDHVRLSDGVEGVIIRIGWRTTQLMLASNNILFIPNSKLATSQLLNFDLPQKETAVDLQVALSSENDLEKVEKVTREVTKSTLEKTSGGVVHVEPGLNFTFSPPTPGARTGVNLKITVRTQSVADGDSVKHALTKNLHSRFKKEGILLACLLLSLFSSPSLSSDRIKILENAYPTRRLTEGVPAFLYGALTTLGGTYILFDSAHYNFEERNMGALAVFLGGALWVDAVYQVFGKSPGERFLQHYKNFPSEGDGFYKTKEAYETAELTHLGPEMRNARRWRSLVSLIASVPYFYYYGTNSHRYEGCLYLGGGLVVLSLYRFFVPSPEESASDFKVGFVPLRDGAMLIGQWYY